MPSIIPMNESGLKLNQENLLSLRSRFRRKWSTFFDTCKQYNEKMTLQFNSGGSRIFSRINFRKFLVGLTIDGKHAWQQEEEQKGDISTALIFQEHIYFRPLQEHSGRNLIDPSVQDNVIIQSGFFQQISHVGCAFNLHSVINNGLILGGKQETGSIFPIEARDKGHQNPATIDFNKPRRAQYMHSAWKTHQDSVFWVDIDLAIQKGLTFYQTRSNAIILQGTLPAYCIPIGMRLKTGEVLYQKSYMSPWPPPKISLRHDHDWTRGKVQ